MLAAAALGALGAQLAGIRAAKADWFVGVGRVDQEDVSLEADGAVTVRRQPPFDKALRNFPKMESPPKGKAERRLEVTHYETASRTLFLREPTRSCHCDLHGVKETRLERTDKRRARSTRGDRDTIPFLLFCCGLS